MAMEPSVTANTTNTMYKSQVAEAVAKGWRVVYSNNADYEGSDPVKGSGDADKNGVVNEFDVWIVADYVAGFVPDEDLNGFDQVAADVDGDGRITIADVTLIIEMVK